MTQRLPGKTAALGLTLVLLGCSRSAPKATAGAKPALLPEPVVNHLPSDAGPGQKIDHGELILDVDAIRKELHAQHHPHGVLETRRVPGSFQPPAMTEVGDFAL